MLERFKNSPIPIWVKVFLVFLVLFKGLLQLTGHV